MLNHWPGGKKSVAGLLLSYAPAGYREYRDAFVGGNALLLSLPSTVKIWINDKSPWVAEFWIWVRDCKYVVEMVMERKAICESLREDEPAARQFFSDCKYRIIQRYHALDFLTLHLWSAAGIVSPHRKNIASCTTMWINEGWNGIHERVIQQYHERLQGAKVTCGDYGHVLNAPGDDVWILADPPYLLDYHESPLYAEDFTKQNHRELATCLRQCQHDWLLTIGNSRYTESLYRGYPMRPRLYHMTMPHRTPERKDETDRTELWIWNS